jgi:hypothetical protein
MVDFAFTYSGLTALCERLLDHAGSAAGEKHHCPLEASRRDSVPMASLKFTVAAIAADLAEDNPGVALALRETGSSSLLTSK